MILENQKTVVIGMGRTGIATANFLDNRGFPTTLVDQKSRKELEAAARLVNGTVEMRCGTHEPPSDAKMIILSPGVDINDPVLDPARNRGAEILSEIELAFHFTQIPIIAVTGTNGKSTVTTLIGEILQRAGKKALVGGNIGTPFISLLDSGEADFLVLEISSFQLEGTKSFRPKIALVLNITPDHMDRHKTLESYAGLKEKITVNQAQEDFLVLNHDDLHTMKLGEDKPARKVFFSSLSEVEEGAFLRNGSIVLRISGEEETILCFMDNLNQTMQWQIENVLAAVAAASLAGVSPEVIAETIKDFKGLNHRMEWVRSIGGIDFVNDSKGTNVGSVQKSLSNFPRPVILIAGGSDKGSDFSSLKQILKERVKHLILIGETKNKFRQVLNGSFNYEEAKDLDEAVKQAYQKAEWGDVVLLSPACASFDMFKDYAERGDRFKSLVNRI
ncbi:MAG: UDP-N-acetylmuramoyl-L-alanine--D-glutamate ligase [Nitrospinota bacterium]|nr:UDP-N-acetylmuramoyl-L-alanine--D-glutamate ligase [Nitrospinota bacterium]